MRNAMLLGVVGVFVFAACSGSETVTGGAGGSTAAAGSAGTTSGVGGVSGAGGVTGAGGAAGTGGATNAGGSAGTGGVMTAGGAAGTGGVAGSGGVAGAGGAGTGGALPDASADGKAGGVATDASFSPDGAWIYPATVPVGDPVPMGDQTKPRKLIIENHCTYTVWVDALPLSTLPNGKQLKMDSGQAVQLTWPLSGWSGRIWGRTGCTPNADGSVPFGKCPSDQYVSNSLAEWTLGNLDFYDVSLVDGFNIPIGIIAIGQTWSVSSQYNCGSPVCAPDVLYGCPASQQKKDTSGNVVACKNGHDPDAITRYFKARCPTSYSWPYDDATSTYTCKGNPSYKVVFCPTEGATPGYP
jgi:hypothetical protein